MFLPVVMHLFVYTRHSAKCPRRHDRFWRRCHCPKWIRGFLEGKPIRASAWTTDWEKAQSKAREMEFPSPRKMPTPQPALEEVENAPQRVTIEEAVDAFLDDEEGRQLRKGTTGQSKTLLRKQLIPWAHQEHLRYLDELTVSVFDKIPRLLEQGSCELPEYGTQEARTAVWLFSLLHPQRVAQQEPCAALEPN